MNVIDIIAVLVAIAAVALYLWKAKQLEDLKSKGLSDEEKPDLMRSELRLENINATLNKTIKELESKVDDLIEENNKLDLDLAQKEDELANLQTVAITHFNETKAQDQHTFDSFPYKPGAVIGVNSLEISAYEFLDNERLIEVFDSLIKANLFPAKITEEIDFQLDNKTVLIFTRVFDVEGEPMNSVSWDSIINQILHKKETLVKYLLGVIQESETAMVVSRVLTEKNKNGQEVKS